MSKDKNTVSFVLPTALRDLILRSFVVQYPDVWCYQLTWEYGVPKTAIFPRGDLECVIYGRHFGDGHEALLVTLGGQRVGPDGRVLCIPLSTKRGMRPGQAKQISDSCIRPVDRMTFLAQLRISRAWVQEPQSLETLYA